MSIVVDPDLALKDNSSAVWVLASQYSSWDHLPSSDISSPAAAHGAVISFLLKVVLAKLGALMDSTRATEAGIVDSILSPHFDSGVSLNAAHLLAAMLHAPSQDDLTLLVLWLFRIHSPSTIIHAAYENVENITTDQMTHLRLSQTQMFSSIVATLGQVCLAQENFADHELLLKLCIFTFFKAVPMQKQSARPRMHWGLFNIVDTILTVAHAIPLPDPGSLLLTDLIRVREVVSTFSPRSTLTLWSFPLSLNHGEIELLLEQFTFIYDHGMRILPDHTSLSHLVFYPQLLNQHLRPTRILARMTEIGTFFGFIIQGVNE
jgi:hypothetical protein